MTTLKLDTLSDRIKAHKNALVHIVKPPVCTERAQHYTEMYQQHLDKPIPVRRALALAHATGKISALNNDKYNILRQRNWRCNVEPTMDELGYHVQYDLRRGVKETIRWYKENKWL